MPGETPLAAPSPDVATPAAVETPPAAPQPAKIQWLRASTVDGRTFELRKKWPPIHTGMKAALPARVDLLAWRGGTDPFWEMRGAATEGTPLAKAGRAITSEVPQALCVVEGFIPPAEHERLVAQRKTEQAEILARLGLESLPGYSRKIVELITNGGRLFAKGGAWPQFFSDPKKELFFRGTVTQISEVAHDDRGLYYEVVGTPAPGTPGAEKGRLLLCEIPRSMIQIIDATYLPDDLALLTTVREQADTAAAQGEDDGGYEEGVDLTQLVD